MIGTSFLLSHFPVLARLHATLHSPNMLCSAFHGRYRVWPLLWLLGGGSVCRDVWGNRPTRDTAQPACLFRGFCGFCSRLVGMQSRHSGVTVSSASCQVAQRWRMFLFLFLLVYSGGAQIVIFWAHAILHSWAVGIMIFICKFGVANWGNFLCL